MSLPSPAQRRDWYTTNRESDEVKDSGAWLPAGTDPVYGDVRHHRERIDQLKEWLRYWRLRAEKAEQALRESQS